MRILWIAAHGRPRVEKMSHFLDRPDAAPSRTDSVGIRVGASDVSSPSLNVREFKQRTPLAVNLAQGVATARI
jgi:hypothetical protein